MATRKRKRRKNSEAKLFFLLLTIVLVALAVFAFLFFMLEQKSENAQSQNNAPAQTAVNTDSAQTVTVTSESTAQENASTEVTPEPTPTPTPESEYFTISLIGDCTLAENYDHRGWSIGYQGVVGDNYSYPFQNTVQYFADDYLTIANLECTLTDNYYTSIEWYNFLAPAAYVNILTEGCVDFVTLANNHVKDYGETAYKDMTTVLDNAGVAYAGEDETYIYQTDDGLIVGIYCLYNNKEPTEAQLNAGLKKLKDAGAQFTIAALHWGVEGAYSVSETQTTMGRYAIDAGFNVVYGSHPHRLEPVEQYNDGLIFYSMANWSFGGNTNPSDYDTAIAQIVVERCGDNVQISDVILTPCSISSSSDINDYCPTPYEEGSEEWERVMSKLNGTFEGADYIPNYQSLIYGT